MTFTRETDAIPSTPTNRSDAITIALLRRQLEQEKMAHEETKSRLARAQKTIESERLENHLLESEMLQLKIRNVKGLEEKAEENLDLVQKYEKSKDDCRSLEAELGRAENEIVELESWRNDSILEREEKDDLIEKFKRNEFLLIREIELRNREKKMKDGEIQSLTKRMQSLETLLNSDNKRILKLQKNLDIAHTKIAQLEGAKEPRT